jgi:Uncharacterized protein conserved in bacteria (DUF2188)
MARDWVHTVRKGGMWVNEIEDGEHLSEHYTKDAAVAAGSDEAWRRRTEHLIHNVDGTIAQRNSYAPDPYPQRAARRA